MLALTTFSCLATPLDEENKIDESDNDGISYIINHFHIQLWPPYDPQRSTVTVGSLDDIEAHHNWSPSFAIALDEERQKF